MKKERIIIILLGISFLLITILHDSQIINAYPNSLDDNIPNKITYLSDHKVNLTIKGNGFFNSSETYLDTNQDHLNQLPNYDYKNTNLQIIPLASYKDKYYGNGNVNHEKTRGLPYTEYKYTPDYNPYENYSDVMPDLEYVEYTTAYSDINDVADSKAEVWTYNPYPLPKSPIVNISGFEDNNHTNYGAWAESRAFHDTPSEYPSYNQNFVTSVVDIGVEIVNSNMDKSSALNYLDYWDLLKHSFNATFETISEDGEIIVGYFCRFRASLLYQKENGLNYSYDFDLVEKNWNITVDDILGGYDSNPSNAHYGFEMEIDSNDIEISEGIEVTEEMFNRYSEERFGIDCSNYGNPVITFRFYAYGLQVTDWDGDEYGYPEEQGRIGAYPNSNPLLPNTLWAKLKISEFDAKHRFIVRRTDNGNNASINHPSDIYLLAYNGTEYNYYTGSDHSIYQRIISGWENRLPTSNIYDSYIGLDLMDSWEKIKVKITNVKAKHYNSTGGVLSDLSICNNKLSKTENYWEITSQDLMNENYTHLDSEVFSIQFNMTASDWIVYSSYYTDYIYTYYLNIIQFFLNFNDITTIEKQVNSSNFNYELNIELTNFSLKGSYVMDVEFNNIPMDCKEEFLYYNSEDVAIWNITFSKYISWSKGVQDFFIISWIRDHTISYIYNFQTFSGISENETMEVNITTSDNIGILDVFIVFENIDTEIRTAFTLNNITGSFFSLDLRWDDLSSGYYSAWYGIIDRSSNYRSTSPFDVSILVPAKFNLISTADDPDSDGKFKLIWSPSKSADNYTIYRYHSIITEINSSVTEIKSNIEDFSYELTNTKNGTYYYAIQSNNKYGKTLSNSAIVNIAVKGDIDAPTPIQEDGIDIIVLVWIIIGITALIGIIGFLVYSNKKGKIKLGLKKRKSFVAFHKD